MGRRWNTDPLEELFVSESPYSVFSNDPINLNDPDGLAPSKGSGPFDPNKRRYRPGRHRNTHNSIGTIFMKSIGWFRQTFTDAKYLTMTYKAGRYKNSGWQTVGSGVVNSGEEDDYSLYSTGILNDKVAGDHLIKVNILTWNDNSPDKRHNSFVSVKGLRRGIGDSHPKYRGLHTNTGVTPWTSDVPFGSGTSNIIPMLDALYDIFEKAENIVMFFSPKAMDFFSQYQAFILAGVLANRNLNPAYYHTSHLRVQNHYSNVPIGYTLQVRSRNWKKKTNNSRLWKKLHRH